MRKLSRGRLEADGEEDDGAVRMLAGELDGIRGRVDDPDVGALGFLGGEARRGAGHLDHVAERHERHVVAARIRDRCIDQRIRRHAHRAPGAAQQPDTLGQQRVQPEAVHGHCVCAADFHERERPIGRHLGDPARERLRRVATAELGENVHASSENDANSIAHVCGVTSRAASHGRRPGNCLPGPNRLHIIPPTVRHPASETADPAEGASARP